MGAEQSFERTLATGVALKLVRGTGTSHPDVSSRRTPHLHAQHAVVLPRRSSCRGDCGGGFGRAPQEACRPGSVEQLWALAQDSSLGRKPCTWSIPSYSYCCCIIHPCHRERSFQPVRHPFSWTLVASSRESCWGACRALETDQLWCNFCLAVLG